MLAEETLLHNHPFGRLSPRTSARTFGDLMGPVDQLDSSVAQHSGAIHRAAANAPAGGGPEWDALLRHYGIVPLGADERSMIVRAMRMSRGAVSAEVRMAFVGLQAWARSEIARLRTSVPPHTLQHVESRIEALVDRETATYERSVGIVAPPPAEALAPPPAGPPGPSLASIFANAEQTSKEVPWAGMTYKSVATLTCTHCGGPQEQPADFICKYCRRPIAGALRPTT